MAPNSVGLMPILELLDQNPPVRRFVGMNLHKVDVDGKERYKWSRKEEGDVVRYHPDYVKAVQQGTLEPMNLETAELCKVEFKQE